MQLCFLSLAKIINYKMVRSDKSPIGTMVTYVGIKDGTLVMFWPITWQEPNHLTERRWARLTPEMRAAPLHYSFPMKKQAICLFSFLFFCECSSSEPAVTCLEVSCSRGRGGQSSFRKCIHRTVLHQCLWYSSGIRLDPIQVENKYRSLTSWNGSIAGKEKN